MRAFILNPTYRVVKGTPEVHLYCVLESGEPCMIIDDRVRPYFFVRKADEPKVRNLASYAALESCNLRSFAGETVLRIKVSVPGEVPSLRQRLEESSVECFEADVRFAYRYMMDRDIRGSLDVEGPYVRHGSLGRIYRNPVLHPCQWFPHLKIMSVDLETSPDGASLYSVALHSPAFSRVIIRHGAVRKQTDVETVHSEPELIRCFLQHIGQQDPDILTGWNVVDFDLVILARAARRHRMRFAIGRTDDDFDSRREASYTRESRALTFGRLVLDAQSLMRGAFIRLQDYTLETAAQTVLGRGKLIKGADRRVEIERLYRSEPQRLVEYNLEDARLVTEILDRTALINLAIERSLLTGMPLDRVSAAIASIDSLYLRALRSRGVVAPSVGRDVRQASITGGYVMDAQPGLYRNVVVFDFKSLYPSIIRTFNLDPLTLVSNVAAASDALEAPNGARFRRDVQGILPDLVAKVAEEREQARKEGQHVKAYAMKILMNSLYGVLGSGASRLFFPSVANAITYFGQLLIRTAAEFASVSGYRVIYGDTDSLFVDSAEKDPERALAVAHRLRANIGDAVAAFVRERFACESYLELEFEKLYLRFFLPELRGGKIGSKKRYAGLVSDADGSERIEFVGLESVRRDWSDASKTLQKELLHLVFHDRPVADLIRSFVADLRTGRFDGQLVYRKAVRKDLEDYIKTTPPHVQAARRQRHPGSRFVEYVMTHHGPEPVGEETAPLDYEHYVEHQIKPVADAILRFLGTSFDVILDSRRQLTLF
jgi:DNA polymerase II